MFKNTVTYKDFNDRQHTEDLYFHILAPEFADLQFNPDFGNDMGTYIKEAMRSGDGAKIYVFFKLMIVNSYGRRSEDGSRFHKKPEWTEEFLNSNAYEAFFMWLVENPQNAEQFWNGIVPQAMLEKVAELEKEQETAGKKKLGELSKEELVAMIQQKVQSSEGS